MKLKYIYCGLSALLFTACGGGGADQQTATLNSKVIDGELIDATVFLDLNKNFVLDSNEPWCKSDENGSYRLDLNSSVLENPNYKDSSAYIVSVGGFDKRSKKEFSGVLISSLQKSGTNNITPVATLINQMRMENNLTFEEAKKRVASHFSMGEGNLTSDPIELAKSDEGKLLKLSLKLQLFSEILYKNLKESNGSTDIYILVAKNIADSNATNEELNSTIVSMMDDNKGRFDGNITLAKAGIDRLNKNIDAWFEENKNKFEKNSTLLDAITIASMSLAKTKTAIEGAILRGDETLVKDKRWNKFYRTNIIKDKNLEIVKSLLKIVGYTKREDIVNIAKLDGINADLTLKGLKAILENDANYANIVSIIKQKLKNLAKKRGASASMRGGVIKPTLDSGLIMTKSRTSDWYNGFCENVKVKNTTADSLVWKVSVEVMGDINNIWNASYEKNSTNPNVIVARGVSWNALLDSNQSTSFGYCATKKADTFANISKDTTSLEVNTIRTSDWDKGFCENVKITNSGDEDVQWNTTTNVDGDIYNLWSAIYTQSTDGVLKASGLNWNRVVKPGRSVKFGYCANKTASSSSSGSSNSGSSQAAGGGQNQGGGQGTASSGSSNSGGSQTIGGSQSLGVTGSGTTDLNYTKVLPLTLKFYEAQRASGPFPTVTWRRAGGLNDGDDVGRDLTGGWFDAGDHVKFNLPMSYSATMLNWGMIAFKDGYSESNQTKYGKAQVKYALDYLLRAYDEGGDSDSPADDKIYYQVGNADADHSFWGPPQDMAMARPTYTCTSENRCSEVAGEMSAALASGSILFRDSNSTYADLLLDKAKKIYNYAQTYQGNNGYTAANGFYSSYSGYNDELAWAAVWLYKATKDADYLTEAKSYASKAADGRYWSQSWDNVSDGVNLLLWQITANDAYKNYVVTYLNHWINGVNTTQGGLKFLDQWGSLRYSSTTAFMALLYAKDLDDASAKEPFVSLAKGQIDYILGANPRHSSYVVGYGINPPVNPHHRAAHDSLAHNIDSPVDNTHILVGALVGGPKSADDFDYEDDRRDYIANEVATDYNAGLVGALAGLVEIAK